MTDASDTFRQGLDPLDRVHEPVFYDKVLSQALYDHAVANYEAGGWDVIVECWSMSDIDQVLAEEQVRSMEGALAAFKPLVEVWADRQADARNSAF